MKQLILFMMCWWVLSAHAEIYKHVDAAGDITYTDYPVPGAKRLHIGATGAEWTNTHKSKRQGAVSTTERLAIPKISGNVQSKRDHLRRTVLEDELLAEQRALDVAKQSLIKMQSSTTNAALPNSQSGKLNEAIKLHQDNVAALNRELSRVQ